MTRLEVVVVVVVVEEGVGVGVGGGGGAVEGMHLLELLLSLRFSPSLFAVFSDPLRRTASMLIPAGSTQLQRKPRRRSKIGDGHR